MSKEKESAGAAQKEAVEELFRTFPDYEDCIDKQLQYAIISSEKDLANEFSDFVHLNRLVKKVINSLKEGGEE